jgi:hypothetical protein
MKNKLFLCIAFSLLLVFLAACGLVANKSDVINCTGTATFSSLPIRQVWNDGGSFSVGDLYTFSLESDCPELNGVMKITENTSPNATSVGFNYTDWGIFRIETAYAGGGVFEGTYHGIAKNSVYNNEAISYSATGSLSGLQLTLRSFDYKVGNTFTKFNATIQNPPQQ